MINEDKKPLTKEKVLTTKFARDIWDINHIERKLCLGPYAKKEDIKECLIKYFHDYTFESDLDLNQFLYYTNAAGLSQRKPEDMYIRGCEEILGEQYELNCIITINPSSHKHHILINGPYNVYSYSDTVGWHEGYNNLAYIYNEEDFEYEWPDDINKCHGPTLEEAITSNFISDLKIEFAEDPFKDIGVIYAGCGYGKTNFVANDLVNKINGKLYELNLEDCPDITPTEDIKLEPYWDSEHCCLATRKKIETKSNFNHHNKYKYINKNEILFITTRRVIKEQQLGYGLFKEIKDGDFSIAGVNQIYDDRDDRDDDGNITRTYPRIITSFKFGELYKTGNIETLSRFKVIVMDEIHSLYLDTMFMEQSYFCLECVRNMGKDIIKIGLTATPSVLTTLMDEKIFYPMLPAKLLPKYKAKQVLCFNHARVKTALAHVKPKEDNKVIVYLRSARGCIKHASEVENGAFAISTGNENEEATERQKPLINFIQEYCRLPNKEDNVLGYEDGVNILFMTSAYREGFELKDESIKTIVIDASDDTTIQQVIGRTRHDIDKVIIFSCEEQLEAVRKIGTHYQKIVKMNGNELIEEYARQTDYIKENNGGTLYIIKKEDHYEINKYLKSVQQYLEKCYLEGTNTERSRVNPEDEEWRICNDYFTDMLGCYSEKPIEVANTAGEKSKLNANWEIIHNYLGKKLYKEDMDRLIEEVNWRPDPKVHPERLPGVAQFKTKLRQDGFRLTEGRDSQSQGKRRWTIIEIENK